MAHAPEHTVRIWRNCDRVARLSDRIVKIGPLNLGLDSALALLPVAGGVYTIGVGAWLVYMGWKAGAERRTLLRMAVYVGLDAATAEIPVLGAVVDVLFPGHILAVKALRRDIERRHGPIPDEAPRRRPRWAAFVERFHRPATA
jgi:hypothetical protein